MCKKGDPRKKDLCLLPILHFLKMQGIKVVASCCGHKKYPPSIVIEDEIGRKHEIFSGFEINRKSRFYKRDKKGQFVMPETLFRLKHPVRRSTYES